MRWACKLSLHTKIHSLTDVAVVSRKLFLDRSVGETDRCQLHLHCSCLNVYSIHRLRVVSYKPIPHPTEAVSDDYHQRETPCTPVLPQKVVVEGFPTMHQVKKCGFFYQTFPLLSNTDTEDHTLFAQSTPLNNFVVPIFNINWIINNNIVDIWKNCKVLCTI